MYIYQLFQYFFNKSIVPKDYEIKKQCYDKTIDYLFYRILSILQLSQASMRLVIVFGVLFWSIVGEIVSPMCKICQKCTYCYSDVLYDCAVDGIYGKIVDKNPQIAKSYPIRITKTVQVNGSSYFFQFSNNFNVTFTILHNSTIPSCSNINLQFSSPLNVSANNNSKVYVSTLNNPNLTTVNTSSSTVNATETTNWTSSNSAEAAILAYAINHYYLNENSTISQLVQQKIPNEYSVQILSNNIIYQLRAAVINGVVTVRSISSNSTQNTNNLLANNNQINSQTQNTTKTTSTSNTIVVGSDPATNNINNPNLLSLNQSMLNLINFIQNQYPNLKFFHFQRVALLNDSTYRLSYSLLRNPSLVYVFDVKYGTGNNIRANSSNYEILSSKWYPLNNSKFIDIGNPVNFYNDEYASLITTQMQEKILSGLKISNAVLVKVEANTPYYRYTYQNANSNITITTQYDPITQNLIPITYQIYRQNATSQILPYPLDTISKNNTISQQHSLIPQNSTNNQSTSSSINGSTSTSSSGGQPSINGGSSLSGSSNVPSSNGMVSSSLGGSPNLTAIFLSSVNNATKLVPTAYGSNSSMMSEQFQGMANKNLLVDYSKDLLFIKLAGIIFSRQGLFQNQIRSVWKIMESNNEVRYLIDLKYDLDSRQILEFTAVYNRMDNAVYFYNFSYLPSINFDVSYFKVYDLQSVGTNKVVLNIISDIFSAYTTYFTSSVTKLQQVRAFTPMFILIFSNLKYGRLLFQVVYNYFLDATNILGFVISSANSTTNTLINNFNFNFTNTNSSTKTSIQSSQNITNLNPMAFSSSPTDVNCISYDGQNCVQCRNQYYLNVYQKRCLPVPPNCSSFNYQTAQCQICSPGFRNVSGSCFRVG